MIVAIDFDGTLCEDKFPEIGMPLGKNIEVVKKLREAGHKTILWTCRKGEVLDQAVAWCQEQGLVFDSVNQNIPEIQQKWGGDTRKVYCDYYIDDKNATFEQISSMM